MTDETFERPTPSDPRAGEETAGPTLVLESFLPYRLSVLANIVSRALARLYEQRFGLTVPEWRVMAILARFGPLSANGVCDRSAMDKVQVSRAVARAVENGLIDRRIDGNDRRRTILSLTTTGRMVHDRIVPLATAFDARLREALTSEEQICLDRVLHELTIRACSLDSDEPPAP